MSTDFNTDIPDIISRKFAGYELNEQERATLDKWLGESAGNKALYRRMSSGASLAEYDKIRSQISARKIILKMDAKKIRRRRILLGTASAAAVLALGVFLFDPFGGAGADPHTAIVAETLPSPGAPKAVLSYADQQVMLTEEEQGAEWEKHVALAGVDDAVQQIMVEIPRGGEYNLRLGDGTSVWLNSESKITYPSRFSGGERKVTVEGEAYFDVAKDEAQPFIVDVRGTEIRVTGTEFNVSAYGSQIETTLISGGVRITAGGNEAALTPGMQAVYEEGGSDISVNEVDTSLYTAWKDGLFRFRNLELSEIVTRLARWYDVEFSFADPEIGNIPFTGAFKKSDPITSILDVIKNTKSVSYDFDGNTVTLR